MSHSSPETSAKVDHDNNEASKSASKHEMEQATEPGTEQKQAETAEPRSQNQAEPEPLKETEHDSTETESLEPSKGIESKIVQPKPSPPPGNMPSDVPAEALVVTSSNGEPIAAEVAPPKSAEPSGSSGTVEDPEPAPVLNTTPLQKLEPVMVVPIGPEVVEDHRRTPQEHASAPAVAIPLSEESDDQIKPRQGNTGSRKASARKLSRASIPLATVSADPEARAVTLEPQIRSSIPVGPVDAEESKVRPPSSEDAPIASWENSRARPELTRVEGTPADYPAHVSDQRTAEVMAERDNVDLDSVPVVPCKHTLAEDDKLVTDRPKSFSSAATTVDIADVLPRNSVPRGSNAAPRTSSDVPNKATSISGMTLAPAANSEKNSQSEDESVTSSASSAASLASVKTLAPKAPGFVVVSGQEKVMLADPIVVGPTKKSIVILPRSKKRDKFRNCILTRPVLVAILGHEIADVVKPLLETAAGTLSPP